jgi:hypothetical protein
MCRTGHRFYAYRAQGIKDWKRVYAPIPDNYTLLNPQKGEFQLPPWVDFDMVLSQNKVGQFQIAKKLADILRVPLISMEHTLPQPNYSESQIKTNRDMRGDIDVFVSEYGRRAWGYPDNHGVVNHTGVDTDMFRPLGLERESTCLSVVNDWINRDWCCGFKLWQQVTGFPQPNGLPVKVVGDTPGLSQPAKDLEELVNHYNRAGLYLNTTTISSLPTVILEAMACECPVVSTATCLIPKIMIKHGKNGFCSNDPNEIRTYCQRLLENKSLAEDIGKAGRETVLEKFSIRQFVETWNEIFDTAAKM